MNTKQKFVVNVELPLRDGCGEEVKKITEGQVRVAVAALPNTLHVTAEEVEEENNVLAEKIKDIFRRYFEADDEGEANPEFDACLTANDVVDEIHELVGNFYKKVEE